MNDVTHDPKVVIDPITDTATTGHEWDGLQELNTPLPRWWLWLFYATIIWAVGYWIVYPAWPFITSYSQGLFGWHSRNAIVSDLDSLRVQRGPMMQKLAGASLDQIVADPQLLDFARAVGKSAFAENCAACHGAGGAGARGYPNLNDDYWLWGGKLANIEQTIAHGVRSNDPDTHAGALMPAFGRTGMLKSPEISAAADYVRSLTGLQAPNADLAFGKKVFDDNCAVCHGTDAKGNRDLGAPNLTNGIWLYSPDKAVIVDGIVNGRGAVMPAWSGRLDPITIKALAVYVWGFGGGEK
jgi:cytochrome c oxidase cbb3-type subunit III